VGGRERESTLDALNLSIFAPFYMIVRFVSFGQFIIKVVMDNLNELCIAFSMKMDVIKSKIMYSNRVHEIVKQSIKEIFFIRFLVNMRQYLGFPFGTRSSY